MAEGTAVITAELHDGRKLTCDLTVEYDPLNIQVGDYYYSDGTASPELIEGKTVVGVVFLKDNITFQDARLRADYPDCVNGLVMALKDSSSVCWQSEASDVSGWAVKNGYPTLKGASSNYAGKYITDAGKLYSGYSNTMALKAYAEAEGKTVELVSNLPQTRPAENASALQRMLLPGLSHHWQSCLQFHQQIFPGSLLKPAAILLENAGFQMRMTV